MNDDPNKDPAIISMADQAWSIGQMYLDRFLDAVRALEPELYKEVENSDASVLYDYLKQYIKTCEDTDNSPYGGHTMTRVMCAAAITRLARAPRADDPLAHYEREM